MNRSALDFRHFVDHLRRQGDLVDVHTEVDANLESSSRPSSMS